MCSTQCLHGSVIRVMASVVQQSTGAQSACNWENWTILGTGEASWEERWGPGWGGCRV